MSELKERRLVGASDVVWVLAVATVGALVTLSAVQHLEGRFELVKLSTELDARADERQRLEEIRDGLEAQVERHATPGELRDAAARRGLRTPIDDEVVRLGQTAAEEGAR